MAPALGVVLLVCVYFIALHMYLYLVRWFTRWP
jgi:hypothetical protein